MSVQPWRRPRGRPRDEGTGTPMVRRVGRTRPVTALAAPAVLATLLTACGSGEADGGAAAPGTQHRPAPIPAVHDPKDVTAVANRPCDLLSAEQAARFGLDRPPRTLPGVLGAQDCEWRNSAATVWVYIAPATDRETLDEVYRNRSALAYFEVTSIAGYPAIVSRTDPRLPVCDIDIKAAERQSVTVSYDSTEFGADPQQGCAVGRQVAEQVVANLPPSI